MKKATLYAALFLGLAAAVLPAQNSPARTPEEVLDRAPANPGDVENTQKTIELTREMIAKWVDTRNQITAAEADWKSEQRILQNQVELLERELAELEEEIEQAEEDTDAAAAQRQELAAQRDELQTSIDTIEGVIGKYEAELRAIVPYLPAPLTEELDTLISKLPNPDVDKRPPAIGERVVVVVTILNQIDKFNNQVTLKTQTYELDDGKRINVSVLYYGLAQAFFADESGVIGGLMRPAEGGWEWIEQNAIAPAVRSAVAEYKKEEPSPEYRLFPVDVQNISFE